MTDDRGLRLEGTEEPDGRRYLAELEPGLRARVLSLDEPVARDDWSDVVRRSRTSGLWARRVGALTGVMAAVVAVVVCARLSSIINLGNSGSPLALGRQELSVLPKAQARRITSMRLSDRREAVYLSKIEEGGFCYKWTGGIRACEAEVAPLEVSWVGSRVVGVVSSADVSSVKIEFIDGTYATPAISWVSSPVDAGFFAYHIPAGKKLLEVIADHDGIPEGRVPWYVLGSIA